VLNVIFPQQVTPGTPTRLDLDVGLRDPATGTVNPAANAQVSIIAAGGTVSPTSGSTDGQGRFTANATLASGSTQLTLIITATTQSGATATKTVTAAAGVAGCGRVIDVADIRRDTDVELLRDVQRITGGLSISQVTTNGVPTANSVKVVDLPCLEEVGNLAIFSQSVITVRLPNLRTIRNNLHVGFGLGPDGRQVGNPALTSLELPALTSVGTITTFPSGDVDRTGDIAITRNRALTSLVIGAARAHRNLIIAGNSALTSLGGVGSLVVDLSFFFGGNGFGEAEALAFANRSTVAVVQGSGVCLTDADARGIVKCYQGPPYRP
jgi:hypothetical protein